MKKKITLLAFFSILVCCSWAQYDINLNSENEEEKQYYHDMGIRSAKQTWWFMDTVLKDNSFGYKFIRVYIEFQEVWLKDIKVLGNDFYQGTIDTKMPFAEGIDVYKPIKFEGVEIDDWLMVDDYYLVGGFVVRSMPFEKRKQLMKVGQFRTNCPAVNEDFVNKSNMLLSSGRNGEFEFPFDGGSEGFSDYFSNNLFYPQYARKLGIEGWVTLKITIEPSGAIQSVKTIRGVGGGLNDVAKDVVWKSQNKWLPINYEATRIFNLPVRFKLHR